MENNTKMVGNVKVAKENTIIADMIFSRYPQQFNDEQEFISYLNELLAIPSYMANNANSVLAFIRNEYSYISLHYARKTLEDTHPNLSKCSYIDIVYTISINSHLFEKSIGCIYPILRTESTHDIKVVGFDGIVIFDSDNNKLYELRSNSSTISIEYIRLLILNAINDFCDDNKNTKLFLGEKSYLINSSSRLALATMSNIKRGYCSFGW